MEITMTADNMKIWDAVGKTDPKHTKHVNQRGGFTSVNANSQIMEATRQFGPIGVGWGYTTEDLSVHNGVVIVSVTLWHGSRDNVFGPMPGCAEMFGKRTDTDAPKKATTDAITKLLSQLGFNADIFLGMWDDNKYVQQRIEETKEKKPEPTGAELRDKLKAWMNAPKTTPEDVRNAWQSNDNFKAKLASLPQPMQHELRAEAERICPDLKEAA
jgi:hypothetical protein|tara:strand:- start:1312 stop:1953 length:642 start_codon:yes stop_codon:yes gene_type:complete